MSITKTFRVYGTDGHRQRVSFRPSFTWDFSDDEDCIRIIDVRNCDKTGTNEYTEVAITRSTEEECFDELDGQISDGLFEDSRTGKVECID